MHLLILTVGSRGDVQPYVALGQGMQEVGHRVTLCTSVRFERFVTERGLAFLPLRDDLVALLDTAVGRGAMEDLGSLRTSVKTFVRLLGQTTSIQHDLVQDGWCATQTAQPDLILYNPKMVAAPHYAEQLGIPAVLAMLFPQLVPTVAFPTLGFPHWPLGDWYNRFTYRIVLMLSKAIGGPFVRAWREANGLPPQPPGTDILHRSDGSMIPVLHGVSPHIVPRPPDWPATVVLTGFWFLDRDAQWEPPAALAAFLEAGPPPVYVGFGSMAGRNPKQVARTVVEAIQRAGVRGVLATGWGGLAPDSLPDTIFHLDQAPHGWLFPRMAAVVHHGGAGTTAAGLRAGRPTVICPFFGDQPFWGRRIQALGAGPAPIPQKQLTAEALAAALKEVTTNPGMRAVAERLGEAIRREDGIANAVAFLEQVYQSKPVTPPTSPSGLPGRG